MLFFVLFICAWKNKEGIDEVAFEDNKYLHYTLRNRRYFLNLYLAAKNCLQFNVYS